MVLFAAKNDCVARYLALSGAILAFAFSVILFIAFNDIQSGLQFEENIPWIASLNINYHLGIDGISLPLILLNNFITVIGNFGGF